MTPTRLLAFLALLTLAPSVTGQVFVPARSAANPTELNSRLNVLMRADFRCQTVLDATEMPGPATLTALALRYDGPSWGNAGGTIASFAVYLAPAAAAPATTSARFDGNYTGTLTQVVQATNLAFPADQTVDPGPWGAGGAFALPLSAPFSYAGTGLVLELRGSGNTNSGAGAANCHLDAEVDPAVGPTTGSVTLNGQGCNGAVLSLAGQLAPATSISCHGSGLGAGALVINTLGASRTSWLGLPLPFDLAVLGAAGCFVHNDVLVDLRTVADASGAVRAWDPATTWPLPIQRSLAGTRLQFQLWSVDPALRLTTTNNAEATIGTYTPLVRGYVTHLHHLDSRAPVATISAPLTPALRFQ